MTIKICHDKFYDRADKILHVLGIILMGIWTLVKYILVGLVIYSMIKLPEHYIWLMGIMTFTMFSVFAWVMHFVWSDENDFAKLNNKLKLFGWNEDC